MNDKLIYRGIEKYDERKHNNSYRYLPGIITITFVISLLIGIKLFGGKIINKTLLTDDKIVYYIDIADKASENKAQVNWQEVAAINEVLNDGNEDELVPKIAEVFLKEEDEGSYAIFTIEEVLDKLKVNDSEEEKVKNFLKEIEESTLYKDLYKDEAKMVFINNIHDSAIESYNKFGILPSITIAQAILESGWGESELATEHNNLFGIKADNRWDGAVATIATKENYDDVIEANFRKYDNILQSIEDHGEFLYGNSRYRENGLFDGKEYISQAQALENAGYSTAENESGEKIYADKLIDVIQRYNLMIFDTEVKRE